MFRWVGGGFRNDYEDENFILEIGMIVLEC